MMFRFMRGSAILHRRRPGLFASAQPSSFLKKQNKNNNYTTTPLLCMPLKKVEVFGLGGGDGTDSSSASSGRLIEIPRLKGSFVEAGDIVGIIQTESGGKYEIPSPSSGRLVDIHLEINSSVKIGDALVTIDTDAFQDLMSPEQKELKQHMDDNNGTVSQEHIEQLCQDIKDVETLRGLAALISDQYPQMRIRALTILERVLQLQQEDKLDDSQHTLNQATTHTDLGILLYRLGDLQAALVQLECALELRKVGLGDESHPELSATYIHIGAIYNQLKDYDKCFDAFNKALQIQKQHLGDDHPLVAASLNNLGAICYHKGDYQNAIPHYEQALQIYLKQQEPDGDSEAEGDNNNKIKSSSLDIAGSHNNLAVALKHVGQPQEAIDHCRKALSIRNEKLGSDHPDTAVSHICLGQIFAETRQVDAAIEQFDQAIQIQTQHYGEHHPTTATTHNHMGALYYESSQFDLALESYQKGLESFQKSSLGADAPQNADCWNNVGLAQQRLGKLDDALISHQNAQRILQTHFGSDHPTLAMTFGNIASVYKSQKNYADAFDYYKRSHVMLEQTLGANHDLVGSSYNNIGQVLALQGQLDDALLQYKAALQIFQDTLSETHVYTGSLHYNIGLVQQQLDDPSSQSSDEAMASFTKAYEIWQSALGDEHPQTNLAEQAMELLKNKNKNNNNNSESSTQQPKKEEEKETTMIKNA